MKKFFLFFIFALVATGAMAVPAKPGTWKQLKLNDGTEVRAQLRGDERMHFWQSADGTCYVEQQDGTYAVVNENTLRQRAKMSRKKNVKSSRLLTPRKVSIGERTHYDGPKKGIIILVNFTNQSFKSTNNLEKYKKIANQEKYSEGKFKGSVYDYFKDQSGNKFELTFDVVGPYMLKYDYAHYGKNNENGDDQLAEEMILEACRLANAEVNFKDYDWDDDDEVDQVYVIYAGKGEADGGNENTIWPHAYSLDETDRCITLDGVTINTYACSCELNGSGNLDGIGTICHEFSHCLGFPDFYDISYSGQFGMGDFDLMCGGSYCGDGYVPCGYTAHEKMMCGWQEPIVLADEDVTVNNLMPMSEHGDTYIIYNEANPDEYYMIENRQKTGWDASYPAKGLLITHVDFDKDVWYGNIPNTLMSDKEARANGLPKGNDHQRMTLFHADNDDDSDYWNEYYETYEKSTLTTDLYPYQKNDSLTPMSKPAATLFNPSTTGKLFMEGSILDIKQNRNGSIDFTYRAKLPYELSSVGGETPSSGVVLNESFDTCEGTGGNDGKWSGTVASSKFNPELDGWVAEKAYSAYHCARFGTGSVPGVVTTPSFKVNGEAKLTFKAAQWGTDGEALELSVKGGTITPSYVEMPSEKWGEFTATIKATGTVSVTFSPEKRFFLDNVKVTIDDTSTIIENTTVLQENKGTFDLSGRRIDAVQLKKGLYIRNGKKIIVK